MLNALRCTEKHGKVCSANWKEAEEGMETMAEGVAKYLSEHSV
jgi:peroxiredoxin (alkyl hydroperoxide reductase subunit C)